MDEVLHLEEARRLKLTIGSGETGQKPNPAPETARTQGESLNASLNGEATLQKKRKKERDRVLEVKNWINSGRHEEYSLSRCSIVKA